MPRREFGKYFTTIFALKKTKDDCALHKNGYLYESSTTTSLLFQSNIQITDRLT